MDPVHPLRTWHRLRDDAGAQPPGSGATSPGAAGTSAETPSLKARVAGLDSEAGRAMSDDERARLGDWFATNILRRGVFPVTLDDVKQAVDGLNNSADPRPREEIFAIAEAGQIRWSPATASLPRGIRYVVARGRAGESGADVLVSTRPPSASIEVFLQIAAWDDTARHFNFYERIGRAWYWEGNSWLALGEPTRGKGPFDSHVNGGLVMKELAQPWMHWESTSQPISVDFFRLIIALRPTATSPDGNRRICWRSISCGPASSDGQLHASIAFLAKLPALQSQRACSATY